jgi:hypothetical protein
VTWTIIKLETFAQASSSINATAAVSTRVACRARGPISQSEKLRSPKPQPPFVSGYCVPSRPAMASSSARA